MITKSKTEKRHRVMSLFTINSFTFSIKSVDCKKHTQLVLYLHRKCKTLPVAYCSALSGHTGRRGLFQYKPTQYNVHPS